VSATLSCLAAEASAVRSFTITAARYAALPLCWTFLPGMACRRRSKRRRVTLLATRTGTPSHCYYSSTHCQTSALGCHRIVVLFPLSPSSTHPPFRLANTLFIRTFPCRRRLRAGSSIFVRTRFVRSLLLLPKLAHLLYSGIPYGNANIPPRQAFPPQPPTTAPGIRIT